MNDKNKFKTKAGEKTTTSDFPYFQEDQKYL